MLDCDDQLVTLRARGKGKVFRKRTHHHSARAGQPQSLQTELGLAHPPAAACPPTDLSFCAAELVSVQLSSNAALRPEWRHFCIATTEADSGPRMGVGLSATAWGFQRRTHTADFHNARTTGLCLGSGTFGVPKAVAAGFVKSEELADWALEFATQGLIRGLSLPPFSFQLLRPTEWRSSWRVGFQPLPRIERRWRPWVHS